MNNLSFTELRIVRRILKRALAQEFRVSVNDGEETTLNRSSSIPDIERELGTTDHNILTFYGPGGVRVGSVLLVWGNEEDVVSDHTDNEQMEWICLF